MPSESTKTKWRFRRIIRGVLLVFLIMALPVAAFVYGLADRIPSEYAEALERVSRLTELIAEQPDQEKLPWEEKLPREYMELFGDFTRYGGAGKPFTYRIKADEVNICLAAMDEIASWRSAEPVRAKAELARAGFSNPVVAMDDGVLTLMVMSTEYKKVFSVDLSFVFDERGDMRMEILAVRVGLLPVPKSMLESNLRQLRGKLNDLLGGEANNRRKRSDWTAAGNVAKFLSKVVSMLDGKAIRPEVTYKFGAEHPLLVKNVQIDDGVLTLHFEPIPRRRAPARTATAPDDEGERPED